jgi:hypothetical protein
MAVRSFPEPEHQPGQNGDGQAVFDEIHYIQQAFAGLGILAHAEADGVVGRAHH